MPRICAEIVSAQANKVLTLLISLDIYFPAGVCFELGEMMSDFLTVYAAMSLVCNFLKILPFGLEAEILYDSLCSMPSFRDITGRCFRMISTFIDDRAGRR